MKPVKERFDDKYQPEPNSGCWIWLGGVTGAGYGMFGSESAHRAAYKFTGQFIPAGAVIMHKCDNKLCVNPQHLRAGSHLENTMDCIAKGRAKKWRVFDQAGERNPFAKLSNEDIIAIRLIGRSRPQKETAAKFGCSPSNVSKILSGVSR